MSEIIYESKATFDNIIKATIIIIMGLSIAAVVQVSLGTYDFFYKLSVYSLAALASTVPTLIVPTSFQLTVDSIIIRRRLKNIKILYINVINAYNNSEGRPLWKLMFPVPGRTYATSRHNIVVIKTAGGKNYIISPSNPEEFARKLNHACNLAKTAIL